MGLPAKTTFYYKVFLVSTAGIYSGSNEVAGTTLPGIDYPFRDDMESAGGNWNPEPVAGWTWISPASAHSGTKAWTDSAGGDYGNNVDSSLVLSDAISLETGSQLVFWHLLDIAAGDVASVEVSTNDGTTWNEVASYTNMNVSSWTQVQVPLGHKTALGRVRFRMMTDASGGAGGWTVDDVSISDLPTAVVLESVIPQLQPNEDRMALKWSRNNDVSFGSYQVRRDTSPGVDLSDTLVREITDPTDTGDTDTGLNTQTNYYYKVFVVNPHGAVAASNELSATTFAAGGLVAYPYFDDMESGRRNWDPEAPWALTDEGVEGWNVERVDLSLYTGQLIGMRFRVRADTNLTQADGWCIDDVRIDDGLTSVNYPFFDNVEAGPNAWFFASPWGRTDEAAYSGMYSWTDSPRTGYADSVSSSLHIAIDLSPALMPVLSFRHRYSLQENADYGHVEVSTNGGVSWTKLYSVTGGTSDWLPAMVDMGLYAGVANVMVRFRIETNGNTTSDGWCVDDIRIGETQAGPVQYPFHDDMEGGTGAWISGSWGLVAEGQSGIQSRNDSPKGNYTLDTWSELVLSNVIDLSAANNPKLIFWHKYDIFDHPRSYESGSGHNHYVEEHDRGRVYVSNFYGQRGTWTLLASYYGVELGGAQLRQDQVRPRRQPGHLYKQRYKQPLPGWLVHRRRQGAGLAPGRGGEPAGQRHDARGRPELDSEHQPDLRSLRDIPRHRCRDDQQHPGSYHHGAGHHLPRRRVHRPPTRRL